MEIKKAIICICCGQKFLVDRDEYEGRKEECLCDKCKCVLDKAEQINEADELPNVAHTFGRVMSSIGAKLDKMLSKQEDNKNNKCEDEELQ